MPASASPECRHRPPQLEGRLFLTDGGLEATLVYTVWEPRPEEVDFRETRRADRY